MLWLSLRVQLTTYFLFTSIIECIGTGIQRLVQHSGNSCGVCAGQQLLYECTVIGPGTTIWKGTAFRCAGGNILLSHNLFSSGTNDMCNNGAIVGHSLSVTDNNCYTSQLSITTDVTMDGETVQCVYNNRDTDITIGTSTINIITDPFDAPHDVRVSDINLDTGHISFNWSSVSTNCSEIHYQITTIDCGICPSTTTNTSITCHGVLTNRVCSIVIRTVACGAMTGNPSSSVSVTLKTSNPSNIHSVPLYSKATEKLKRIITMFEQADSFMISDGIDGSATSYTINYLDTISGDLCSSGIIPASSCVDGICNHTFEVSTSSCPPCVDVNITVYSTNILGNGAISDPLTIDNTNRFVNIKFDLLSSSVRCMFEQQMLTSTEKSCSIVYGPGEQCTNLSQSSRSESSSTNSVIIDYELFPSQQSETVYCYVLTAYDGTFSASIEGTFSTGCDPQQLSDGISLPTGVSCSAPLHSLGIKNGIVCYNGIDAGAVAFYSCFHCDSQVTFSHLTARACLPNGQWNGSIPQCECDASAGLSHNNASPRPVTGVTLALVATTASLGLIIFIMLTIFITVIVILARIKAKLQAELRQVKTYVLYDEIGLPPSTDASIAKNIAYDCVKQ